MHLPGFEFRHEKNWLYNILYYIRTLKVIKFRFYLVDDEVDILVLRKSVFLYLS